MHRLIDTLFIIEGDCLLIHTHTRLKNIQTKARQTGDTGVDKDPRLLPLPDRIRATMRMMRAAKMKMRTIILQKERNRKINQYV